LLVSGTSGFGSELADVAREVDFRSRFGCSVIGKGEGAATGAGCEISVACCAGATTVDI
jgi:hypothetical protein